MSAEVDHRLELHRPGPVAPEKPGQELARGLDPSLGPAPLLHLQGARTGRDLGGDTDVVEEDEAPPRHLGPVAQVEILGQGVGFPPAGLVQTRPTPDPGGAVEVEEAVGGVAAALLEEEVAVEEERLGPGEPALLLVQVVPAGLNHSHRRIPKGGQEPVEEVWRGHEVGVENEEKLPVGRLEPVLEGPRLVSRPTLPPDELDPDSLPAPPADPGPGTARGLVRRVVEHLHLQLGPGIAQAACRVHEAPDHVLLVVEGKLDRDPGKGAGPRRREPAPAGASPQPEQVRPVEGEGEEEEEDPPGQGQDELGEG